jgi:hypothetical protein
MDRVEIVAYRAIVRADLRGRALPHGFFAMIAAQGGGNHHNQNRRQEVDPLAYFRPKTVQTLGGKLNMKVLNWSGRGYRPGQGLFDTLSQVPKQSVSMTDVSGFSIFLLQ